MESIVDQAGRIAIAQDLLGPGNQIDQDGFADCPGKQHHSAKNGRRDFRLWLDDVPYGSCFHSSCSAEVETFNKALQSAIGKHEWSLAHPGAGNGEKPVARKPGRRPQRFPDDPPVEFDPDALRKAAGDLAGKVDAEWLGNRSDLDVSALDPWMFLDALYTRDENVMIFTSFYSQGDFCFREGKPWRLPQSPKSDVPMRARPRSWIPAGKNGVWFLNQPMDLVWHEHDKIPDKWSRRSVASVTAFRYMVLESDHEGFEREWVAFLCRLPIPIVAMYKSGGKSIHALVRVDAPNKMIYDKKRREITPLLTALGADPSPMSSVRLTRLPFCKRGDRLQKLLYLSPHADGTPIENKVPVRSLRDLISAKPEHELSKLRRNYYRIA